MDGFNYIPLYIQISDDIRGKIENKVYGINSKLPGEDELQQQYNVSQATIRQALDILEQEGYLTSKSGAGMFVRKRRTTGFEPFVSLVSILGALDHKINTSVIEKRVLILNDSFKKHLNWMKFNNCFYLKRKHVLNELELAIESAYFSQKLNHFKPDEAFDDSLFNIIVNKLHVPILEVEQKFILRKAVEEEINTFHLEVEEDILQIEKWIYAENMEEPCVYSKTIIPNDFLINLYYNKEKVVIRGN